MARNLMPPPMYLLNRTIIRILVTQEERGLDLAPVRVLPLPVEYLVVQLDVVVVYGVVERDRDHLGDLGGWEVPWDCCPVFGAEAVGEDADGFVAWGGAVWVVVYVAVGFVGAVLEFGTVWLGFFLRFGMEYGFEK